MHVDTERWYVCVLVAAVHRGVHACLYTAHYYVCVPVGAVHGRLHEWLRAMPQDACVPVSGTVYRHVGSILGSPGPAGEDK